MRNSLSFILYVHLKIRTKKKKIIFLKMKKKIRTQIGTTCENLRFHLTM